MEVVLVYNLALVGPDSYPAEIQFSTLPNSGMKKLPITISNVISHHPLQVRVFIPQSSRIHDMRHHEGTEVIFMSH